MKKKVIYIALIAVLVFGFFGFVNINKGSNLYAQTSQTEELKEESEGANFFREKIMPFLTANISGIMSAVFCFLLTQGKLKLATAELSLSNKENKKLKDTIGAKEKEITALKEDIKSIKSSVEHNNEMLKIAFCHTNELVSNGYAQEIAKVGANEEQKD